MKKQKKTFVILWIIEAVFLVSVPSCFSESVGAGLLCLFFVALFAFLGYRKYSAPKKAAKEEAVKQSSASERRQLFNEKHGTFSSSVAGVSFDNDDGSSRQYALKQLKGKEKREEYYEVALQQYEFKGKPAFYVIADGRCVGNIKAEDVSEVLSFVDRIEFISLSPYSFRKDDGGLMYGADIEIRYSK